MGKERSDDDHRELIARPSQNLGSSGEGAVVDSSSLGSNGGGAVVVVWGGVRRGGSGAMMIPAN